VIVFGALNVMFGGLGLACIPLMFVALAAMPEAAELGVSMKVWTAISYSINFACSVWLLVLGIGLLNCKRWGRTGSIAYAWFNLLFAAVGMVVNIGYLVVSDLLPAPGEMVGLVGAIAGVALAFVYPILLIVFMKRPAVVEACRR